MVAPSTPTHHSPSPHAALCSVASGGITFIGTCTASQLAQKALLNIHTGSRWIAGVRLVPSLLGACTIGAASVASVVVGEAVAGAIDDNQHLRRPHSHASVTAVLGAACFLGFGGRFWRLSPSGLADLGALANTARGSLPATLAYATKAEREAMQVLGRRFGCHSCGARPLFGSTVKYIADHQPPLATVKLANAAIWRRVLGLQVTQRFYPQCVTCSGKQATLLAERTALINKLGSTRRALQAGTVSPSVFHMPSPLRPRYAVGAMLEGLARIAPDAVELVNAKAAHVVEPLERAFVAAKKEALHQLRVSQQRGENQNGARA